MEALQMTSPILSSAAGHPTSQMLSLPSDLAIVILGPAQQRERDTQR